MKAKRVREPYILSILDQGTDKGEYRFCVVAFDVNGHQIPEIQGYKWHEEGTSVGNKTIWLARRTP